MEKTLYGNQKYLAIFIEDKRMSENEEFLDVVNEKGEFISSHPRSKIHGNPELLHQVVHVLVFDPQGRLILQKRPMTKDVAPGKWDTSVGGHVSSGESLELSMEREMAEELGIPASSAKPSFLYQYIHGNDYESELVHTYACHFAGEIKFDQTEIDAVKAFSLEDIRNNLGTGLFSDNFEHEFQNYLDFMGKK
jgi:isopentenyldiphosphate isomerase